MLITARSGALDTGRAAAAAADVRRRLDALPVVTAQQPPVTAPGGRAVLVRVQLARDPATAADRVGPMEEATAAVQAAYPELRVEQVGDATVEKALNRAYGDDFRRAEMLSLPVTLVILVVAFGALQAAAVPVLLALTSVAAALGLSALASHLLTVTDTTSSVVLLIGMAVGVDYSLFYVRRAREERAAGRTALDAVEVAAATSARAVVVSGGTVAVAMAGMFLTGSAIFSSLAVGAILVAVAVLGSITVLPAAMTLLGRWNWWAPELLRRRLPAPAGEPAREPVPVG